ncbi:heavy-metal-associated domain-containing protein [Peribacillus kribbensis]|uniref:heavy-metal-associated domain-containing protein n=1 Tax=Peribacillus kribbensis TaxID=356658 RepID=UPI0004194FB6|nr:hypothetical protein [Peribacillus kribbensis]
MEEQSVIKINSTLTNEDKNKIVLALNDVWGVLRADVNILSSEARIGYDKNAASCHDFQQAIRDAGYDIATSNNDLPK